MKIMLLIFELYFFIMFCISVFLKWNMQIVFQFGVIYLAMVIRETNYKEESK